MALSLYSILTQQNPRGVNVLAQDTATDTALANAIASGVMGGTLQMATEVGNRPIDLVIPKATAPATDGAPLALFRVDFRVGSAADGSTPAQLLVLAWPQQNGSVTTPAATLASEAAAANAKGVVSQVSLVANVDIDSTQTVATSASFLTKLQFRLLFTLTELVAIDNYQTNTSLSSDQKNMLNTIMANFAAAEDISLTDPATIQGVNYLATAGLITTARAAQVLAGEAAPAE